MTDAKRQFDKVTVEVEVKEAIQKMADSLNLFDYQVVAMAVRALVASGEGKPTTERALIMEFLAIIHNPDIKENRHLAIALRQLLLQRIESRK